MSKILVELPVYKDMKVEKEGMPRRYRVDLFTPIEKSIYDLQGEVEMMGADVRLTDALNLLIEARHKIADFVEECPQQSHPWQ